jgi:transposase
VDLRARVIGAVEAGASRREAAERFDLRPSAVINWVKRYYETGSAAAKPCGGSTSPLEEHTDWLLSLIAEQPNLTLDEIVAAIRKQHIPGSRGAVWRFERYNVTVKKKSLRATERDREDVAKARRRRMRQQGPARLVFIDETATGTNMVRLKRRCPRGERLIGEVPQGRWETLMLVAGLRCDGPNRPSGDQGGAMDGTTFLAYVCRNRLTPWLMPRRVTLAVARCRSAIHAALRCLLEVCSAAIWVRNQQRSG